MAPPSASLSHLLGLPERRDRRAARRRGRFFRWPRRSGIFGSTLQFLAPAIHRGRVIPRPAFLHTRIIRSHMQGNSVQRATRVATAAAAWCLASACAQGTGQAAPAPEAATGVVVDTVTAVPVLLNRAEVDRAIRANYPPLMRDAGVTGVARVHLRVNADGTVDRRSIVARSFNHESFADAARRVAGRMRFRPAERDGVPVAMEITVPVEFKLP